MSPTTPPNDPRSVVELAEILVEIVRREGGVIWKDRALDLLAKQEDVTSNQARYALTQATAGTGSLEYAFGNENWYPSTVRLTGETRSKPSEGSADTLQVPRDLLERCLGYATSEQSSEVDGQRLKRLLAGRG